MRDFIYPEYPIHLKAMAAAKLPCVWDPWLEDTAQDLDDIIKLEQIRPQFDGHRLKSRVIRDDSDWKEIMKIISD